MNEKFNLKKFLNNSGLVVNNVVDVFYISIFQVILAVSISHIFDRYMYKYYDSKIDEEKNSLLLLLEFALMCSALAALSYSLSKIIMHIPFPFQNTLHANLNFDHNSIIINKNDAIMSIVLFTLCKPLQSKLYIIKKNLGLVKEIKQTDNIVPYNTPTNELKNITQPTIIKPNETITPPNSLPSLIGLS